MISDAVAAALPSLRAEAESLMTLTVTVSRASTGETTVDEATGLESAAATQVYAGRCDLVRSGSQARTVDTAGSPDAVLSPVLKLPVSAPPLRAGDVCVLGDGRRFVVRANVTHAHPVTARYQLDD